MSNPPRILSMEIATLSSQIGKPWTFSLPTITVPLATLRLSRGSTRVTERKTEISCNKTKVQGAKGQDQHQSKFEQDAATTCNYNHHHHQPDLDQHCWSARCSDSNCPAISLRFLNTLSSSLCGVILQTVFVKTPFDIFLAMFS